MSKAIVLCGFMGCGKTSVGRKAAKLLGREFYDLDICVEQKTGMTVSEIFESFGEARFRELESEALLEACRKENAMIASGGGTVLFEKNLEIIHKSGGTVFFLDVPLPALQERLKSDNKRPLIQGPDRRGIIEQLFQRRIPLYRAAADITVPAGAPPVVVAERIRELGLHL